MKIDISIDKPIFIQIADEIENSIFKNIFLEEDRILSTNEMAKILNVNPHTIMKGINILVEQDILYKKRGLGMYVKKGAIEIIKNKRKEKFYNTSIVDFVNEAKNLEITKDEIINIIERSYDERD